MVKEYINLALKHRHTLIFAAGFATAVAGIKILESEAVIDASNKGMAAVMSAKKDVEEAFQGLKENAEDIVVDTGSETKKKISITEDDE